MLSALMPTKGRVSLAKRAIESIKDTAWGPIEVILGVDESEFQDYCACKVPLFAYPDGHGGSWKMHRLAKQASGEAMMCFHDDMVAVTQGWDRRFRELLREDPYRVLYFKDDPKRHRGLTEPVVSRKWWELGGFYPDFFHHYGGDTFGVHIAEMLGKLVFVQDVVLEHRHFKNGSAPYDDTYKARDVPHKINSHLVQKAQRQAMDRIKNARNAV
jgi:glycosyltransferase involved in cell wall biosynthesis